MPSRTTHVNSRMSSSSFSGLPSRTTFCIIFPTISPFGLDGNHDAVWLPQQIDTLRLQWHHVTLPNIWHHYLLFIQTPCHSPPLTSRAKGGSNTNILSLFSPHVEEAFCRSDMYRSDQAPPEFMLNLQTYFSMKYMTLWPSYHQWLILTSKIHPSGFTYETQIPNQVGLHISTQLPNQVGLQIWLSYPTKWVYTIWLSYPTKWVYKIDKSLHDWILQFYIMDLIMTFSSIYKDNFKTNIF